MRFFDFFALLHVYITLMNCKIHRKKVVNYPKFMGLKLHNSVGTAGVFFCILFSLPGLYIYKKKLDFCQLNFLFYYIAMLFLVSFPLIFVYFADSNGIKTFIFSTFCYVLPRRQM